MALIFLVFSITIRTYQYEIIAPADSSTVEIQHLVQYLKTAETTTTSFLEINPPRKITIVLCPTSYDFSKLTGQPVWQAARTIDSTLYLQPIRTLENRGIAQATITHEYSHLLLDRYELPIWLEEGLAVYLSGEVRNLKRTADGRAEPKPAAIEKMLRSSDPDSVQTGYWSAFRQTVLLIAKIGKAGIIRLVKNEPTSIPRQ